MTLPIAYSDLLMLILAIFAFVGIMRGWYKEGVTSIFAAALALLVWQPEVAEKIIETINDLIKLFVMFFKAGGSLEPDQLMTQTVDPGWFLDPDSYRLYIVVTVVLLIVSYIVGDATFKGKVTPLSRLIGGLLGAFNGYVILSLVRQYLVRYMGAKYQVYAADQMSVSVTEMPASSVLAGPGIIFIFIVLIAVIALLIAGDRLKLPLK
jgi:hypothetical protein